VDSSLASGFLLVFVVIGGLELFDRTSFALIAYASRSHAFASWAGAALAFVLTSALAVTVGAALVAALGEGRIGLVRVVGGIAVIGYAVWVYYHPDEESNLEARPEVTATFVAAFATIFVLELADATMIFEIVFVASYGWLLVFAAGASALVLVAAWNVFLGRTLGQRIPPLLLNRIMVVVLLAVGALTILYGLYPSSFPDLSVAMPLG